MSVGVLGERAESRPRRSRRASSPQRMARSGWLEAGRRPARRAGTSTRARIDARRSERAEGAGRSRRARRRRRRRGSARNGPRRGDWTAPPDLDHRSARGVEDDAPLLVGARRGAARRTSTRRTLLEAPHLRVGGRRRRSPRALRLGLGLDASGQVPVREEDVGGDGQQDHGHGEQAGEARDDPVDAPTSASVDRAGRSTGRAPSSLEERPGGAARRGTRGSGARRAGRGSGRPGRSISRAGSGPRRGSPGVGSTPFQSRGRSGSGSVRSWRSVVGPTRPRRAGQDLVALGVGHGNEHPGRAARPRHRRRDLGEMALRRSVSAVGRRAEHDPDALAVGPGDSVRPGRWRPGRRW